MKSCPQPFAGPLRSRRDNQGPGGVPRRRERPTPTHVGVARGRRRRFSPQLAPVQPPCGAASPWPGAKARRWEREGSTRALAGASLARAACSSVHLRQRRAEDGSRVEDRAGDGGVRRAVAARRFWHRPSPIAQLPTVSLSGVATPGATCKRTPSSWIVVDPSGAWARPRAGSSRANATTTAAVTTGAARRATGVDAEEPLIA